MKFSARLKRRMSLVLALAMVLSVMAFGSTVTAAPSPGVTGFTAEATGSSGQVSLRWSRNTNLTTMVALEYTITTGGSVNWQKVTGSATGVRLTRNFDSGGCLRGNATETSVSGLENGIRHYFRLIFETDGYGNPGESVVRFATPRADAVNYSGGGGGGGASIAPGAGQTTAPVSIPVGNTNLPGTVNNETGNVSLTLNATAVQSLINDAVANAEEGETGIVAINLSGVANAVSTTLTSNALAQFAEAGLDVAIALPQGTLVLDPDAAASLAEQAGANVTLSLDRLGVSDIPQAQRREVRGSDVIFSITALSGNQLITNFDGSLTISVPYTGPTPAAVWYLNPVGSLEKRDSVFDSATGLITFTTNHLSMFVVGLDGMRIRLTIGSTTYVVDGETKEMDVAPEIVGDRTMVPLRFVAEALGAEVGWNPDTRTAGVELDGANIFVTIGELGPGMDVPAMISNSRTMVPLRFVTESLGCLVDWNAEARTVDISK
jgi:hypothetical protein